MGIRVVIADDQALLRTGFGLILNEEHDIEVVGEAENGLDAVDVVARLRPDVVLMDVRMPGIDGLEATRRITAAPAGDPPVRILVLTTFDLNEYVYAALRAGASGFLLKDVQPDELADAIRVVAAGNSLFGPAATQRLLDRFVQQGEPREPPAVGELTDREREILELLARGLSNAEIAERLFLSEATVKSHVSAILRKLGVRDRVQAVIAAYEAGIVRAGT
jgi:DNA-binding NarL/FixJ family response regulator